MEFRDRLVLCAAVAVMAGCAHVEAPTGGPQIRGPLELQEVRPDSLVVVEPFRGPVVFTFERRLSEQGLRDAVIVSPETSAVSVSHSGRELRVSLRNGWEPNQIYHVTVFPTLQDLWTNRPPGETSTIFSTGAELTENRLTGTALDRITGRPEIGIRVEAIRLADSLVYATRTDSAGRFTVDRVPGGDYLVRAYRDLNRNRELDEFEPRDTALLALEPTDSAAVRLRIVQPDTVPPVPQRAELVRGNIEVHFDDHLDPEQPLDPSQVEIIDPTGARVGVARLAVGELAAIPETVDTPDVDTPIPAQPAVAAPPGAAVDEPEDEPLPSQRLVAQPEQELAPATTYRVIVHGIVNVVGLAGGGEITFTTPEEVSPPTPPDLEEDPEPAEGQDPVAAGDPYPAHVHSFSALQPRALASHSLNIGQ